MSQLELNNMSKSYQESNGDTVVAVDDLSLSIEDGEFLVLVGPSGCGKSTTLHCIAGLEEVTGGEIRIEDDVVNEKKPEARNIAMVFQNYALYPHKTARQNMAFGLKMTTNMSDDEISERVMWAADLLEIEELLDDKPSQLSGGQQQRVALGRAIVREPSAFLMDEPLSNLDAKLRSEMRTEIQELQRELNTTTVYVTHDQTEAMTMGDRIAILDQGELQQVGTPLECYHEPSNLFVAGFIGEPSMNFIELQRDDSQLTSENIEYTLSDELVTKVEPATQVTMGIRPEDIELASTVDETGPTVSATAEVVEPMGDRNILHLDLNGTELTATLAEDELVSEGTTVDLHFPESRLHFFETTTGDALVNRRGLVENLPSEFATEVGQA
ncbi:ABC transporter ATP-binding protein [Halorussus salinisoli]|uniref:ABC transporter ATP-binding protein n=1 Tax=Halorussus salinisoli TaxID=2558242 RepID=UPI0010C1924C|nr:sn-glycerol-3-phosphate ABC transporter ATP-binding protein UgpC [Halorussus salinisoli]